MTEREVDVLRLIARGLTNEQIALRLGFHDRRAVSRTNGQIYAAWGLNNSTTDEKVARTRAAASEALAEYGQAVLTALREVEDALAKERRQVRYLASLVQQLKLSGAVQHVLANTLRTIGVSTPERM